MIQLINTTTSTLTLPMIWTIVTGKKQSWESICTTNILTVITSKKQFWESICVAKGYIYLTFKLFQSGFGPIQFNDLFIIR